MNIIADLHTHTTKSYSGASTLFENLSYASKKKLNIIALTDYGPNTHSSKKEYLEYIDKIPQEAYNISILKGIEANVLDLRSGKLDIEEQDISHFDWIIGSYHKVSDYDDKILNRTLLTDLFTRLATNPLINTIGHMERYSCGFDIPKIISLMKEQGKVIEVGVATFKLPDDNFSKRQLLTIINTCKELSAPICIVSNSHYCDEVGKFEKIIEYLDSINFPEQLIINSNKNLLTSYIDNFKTKRDIELKKAKENYGVTLHQYRPLH